jgi:ATP phosphoribosyltransferase regulatory subunit
MAAETVQQFAALEAQAQTVMSVFTKAGHEAVAPAILQPAGVFLDVIGEDLRGRTYVFTDPDGAELCLRPDLTVPACRLHIARYADPATPAKYCYNGPAFRYQAQNADASHPREFRQAGIERFGDADAGRAEADTIALLLKALTVAGLREWSMQIGDLGLFKAVLGAVEIPSRWQKQLYDSFWRPEIFQTKLKRLTSNPAAEAKALPTELVAALVTQDVATTAAAVGSYLDTAGIEVIGTRTLEEVAERLLDIADDLAAWPLEKEKAELIEAYVAVKGPAKEAGEKIAKILRNTRGGTGAALDAYDRRLAMLANAGIPLARISFSAEFGRNLEYYTGLVFEIFAPSHGRQSAVAGGGRYDGLMRSAGAKADVPAVGGAIHTERLLSVINGGLR